jgi:hypothetical protein
MVARLQVGADLANFLAYETENVVLSKHKPFSN